MNVAHTRKGANYYTRPRDFETKSAGATAIKTAISSCHTTIHRCTVFEQLLKVDTPYYSFLQAMCDTKMDDGIVKLVVINSRGQFAFHHRADAPFSYPLHYESILYQIPCPLDL